MGGGDGGWGGRENPPFLNPEQPPWGLSCSVWIEPTRDGCATCPGRSFVKASRWAQSIGSSLTFVSSLNFFWIHPRVMNQKILGFWCFCYEFLGVCNSVAQKQLFWLEMTWKLSLEVHTWRQIFPWRLLVRGWDRKIIGACNFELFWTLRKTNWEGGKGDKPTHGHRLPCGRGTELQSESHIH